MKKPGHALWRACVYMLCLGQLLAFTACGVNMAVLETMHPSPAPQALAPASIAITPAPTVTITPTPSAIPTIDPAFLLAQQEAERASFVQSCVYPAGIELRSTPALFVHKPVTMIASVESIDTQKNTALLFEHGSQYMQIQAAFSDPVTLAALSEYPYAILYGVYTGFPADNTPETSDSYIVYMRVEYARGFAPDPNVENTPLTQKYLNGDWRMDPEGNTHINNEYFFNGKTLLVNAYLYGTLCTVFDGTYSITAVHRIHHRYDVTAYRVETGEFAGHWENNKLNHEITPFSADIMRVYDGFYFRAGAELPPFLPMSPGEGVASPEASSTAR